MVSHFHQMLVKQASLSILSATLVAAPLGVLGAQITKVKGKQVMMEFSPEEAPPQKGNQMSVLIGDKEIGRVEIIRHNKRFAIGQIISGKAPVDAVVAVGSKIRAEPEPETQWDEEEPKIKAKLTPGSALKKTPDSGAGRLPAVQASESAGQVATQTPSRAGLFSYLMSNAIVGAAVGFTKGVQSVNTELGSTGATETVKSTGSETGVLGYVQVPFSGPLDAIGRLGLEQLSVSGSSSFGAQSTAILYAKGEGLLRLNFAEDGFIPWVGGGLGFHYPVTKSSDIIQEENISATLAFLFMGGTDFKISSKSYFTLGFEYGSYPTAVDVKTTFTTLRAGFGYRL